MSVPAFQAACQDCTGYGFFRLDSGIFIFLPVPGGTYVMEKRMEHLDGPEGEQQPAARKYTGTTSA